DRPRREPARPRPHLLVHRRGERAVHRLAQARARGDGALARAARAAQRAPAPPRARPEGRACGRHPGGRRGDRGADDARRLRDPHGLQRGSQARAPDPGDVPRSVERMNADAFVNRELSWLEFDRRVLEEAEDPTVPLLERIKFLAIVSSNLDEFFMVRVAGLKRRIRESDRTTGPDGLTAGQTLAAVADRARSLSDE